MAAALDGILGGDGLARFGARNGVLHGLPATAYTSEAFRALENARLFADHWVFAGFAHELATPGDAVPVTVGGRPLLLLRDGGGAIGAFHNVCRHRGLVLVDAPGNVGAYLVCPYHTWTYGLDGALCRTPHFGGPHRHAPDGFDATDHGLKRVRCAVWHDWVFVNPGGGAPDFDIYSAALARRLDGVDLARMRPVATLDFGEVPANWKFLMENFIEPYHVQFVHSSTTEQPLKDHSTFIDGMCLGSAVDVAPRAGGGRAGANTLAVSSRYLTLFPNFVLGFYVPDQIGVHLNLPLGPGRTHQRRVIYHIGDAAPPPEAVEALARLWRGVHAEDHAMVARLQRGRASEAAADGGLLSPHWEDSVRSFQELVIEALGGPPAAPSEPAGRDP